MPAEGGIHPINSHCDSGLAFCPICSMEGSELAQESDDRIRMAFELRLRDDLAADIDNANA